VHAERRIENSIQALSCISSKDKGSFFHSNNIALSNREKMFLSTRLLAFQY
jgi:hypothetical protein